MLSVRTSANGHGRGERSGPRTWDTFAQRIDDTPPLSPRSSAQRSTTTEKKKFGIFWQILADFWPRTGPARLAAPGATRRVVATSARGGLALIAQ